MIRVVSTRIKFPTFIYKSGAEAREVVSAATLAFGTGMCHRQCYQYAIPIRVKCHAKLGDLSYVLVCHQIQAAETTLPQTAANSIKDSQDAATLSLSRLIP
jgi:hypothetical protein